MQVEIAQHRREGISVRHFADAAVVPLYPQAIVARLEVLAGGRRQRFEYSLGPVAQSPAVSRGSSLRCSGPRSRPSHTAVSCEPECAARPRAPQCAAPTSEKLRHAPPGPAPRVPPPTEEVLGGPSYRFPRHSRPCMLRQLRQMSPSLSPCVQHPGPVRLAPFYQPPRPTEILISALPC